MFQYSVRSFDEITHEFGSQLNGFLPVVVNNLSQRGRSLPPSDLGSPRQFEKGYDRLKSWLNIAGLNPNPRYYGLSQFWSPTTNQLIPIKSLNQLDKLQKSFCLSTFIIIFQVFGDGNHRAANYYFNMMTGRELSDNEKQIIHDVHSLCDYSLLLKSKDDYVKFITYKIEDIIDRLVSRFNRDSSIRSVISSSTRGGKRQRRYKHRKTLRKKRSNRSNRSNRKNRKNSRK